jgi:hypothetical protein
MGDLIATRPRNGSLAGWAYGIDESIPSARKIMQPRAISARMIIGFAVGAAVGGCAREVNLGDIGDGGAALLWTATFEPGDLSEWTADGGGNTLVDISAGVPLATNAIAHRGRYAGRSLIAPAMGATSLSYLYRDEPSPKEAYYSAWFYVPSTFAVKSWLSLSHFRGSPSGRGDDLLPLWDVNLYPRLGDGALVAHLYNYSTLMNAEEPIQTVVPLDTWVQFEVLLRKATDATGRIAVWQDGVLVIDVQNVQTTLSDVVQWDAGGASDSVIPSPATVFLDDAAISLIRVGTGQ